MKYRSANIDYCTFNWKFKHRLQGGKNSGVYLLTRSMISFFVFLYLFGCLSVISRESLFNSGL